MTSLTGWGRRLGALLNENRGPWSGGGGGDDGGDGEPRSPWGRPSRRPRRSGTPGNITSFDEFLKKSRDRFGGRFPHQEGRPYWLYGLAAVLILWVALTSFHEVAPRERGVVTRFGRLVGITGPGMQMTFPSPIDRLQKVNVENIRQLEIGNGENLILTGDQNIIDLAYTVRWNVKDPQLYLYQIKDPDDTVKEVAESAMRAIVATVSLDDAIGSGRSVIEQRVEQLTQQVLDRYGSGIAIQGVSIKQSDPPAAVNDAFKDVLGAQQDAQSYINTARGYAQQVTAKAQGEAAAFDKVYIQYKLAPEVTRRRMYYETMERVLAKVDKTILEAKGVTPYLPLPDAQRRAEGK
jgi:membrane protease subunit HflK